jgi:hypothetical protein
MFCECKRCKHYWESRAKELPKECPACKSYKWNIELINKTKEDKKDGGLRIFK